MLLDLIIENEKEFTWKVALMEHQEGKAPLMPMEMKEAVQGARYLNDNWVAKMPRHYVYHGDANSGKGELIEGREKNLIELWFEHVAKQEPKNIQEAVKIISDSIEQKWYGIPLAHNFGKTIENPLVLYYQKTFEVREQKQGKTEQKSNAQQFKKETIKKN